MPTVGGSSSPETKSQRKLYSRCQGQLSTKKNRPSLGLVSNVQLLHDLEQFQFKVSTLSFLVITAARWSFYAHASFIFKKKKGTFASKTGSNNTQASNPNLLFVAVVEILLLIPLKDRLPMALQV